MAAIEHTDVDRERGADRGNTRPPGSGRKRLGRKRLGRKRLGRKRLGGKRLGRKRLGRNGLRAVRVHWLFSLVLTAGLALRLLAQVAYRPALLYIDSAKYLAGSDGSEPEGYRVLLLLADPLGGLGLVAAVQHAFGLAMAVAVYALLIRRRVPRWVAAIATAPVLLDAYQLQLEQTIMPDVLFETMIAAGLVLLLWPRHPGPASWWLLAAGALALGAATTVREIGAVLIVPVLIFTLLTRSGLTGSGLTGSGLTRSGWRPAALAGACFVLPVLGYLTAAYGITGHVGLASNGPGPEYGRAATAADCTTLKIPADERVLCPSPALTLALGGIDGLLHNPHSPGLTVAVPPGTSREKLLAAFSGAVFRQQPLRVAGEVVRDSVRLFALTRDGDPEITSISRWQFQTFYPTYPPRFTMARLTQLARQHGDGGTDLVAVGPIAAALRAYQLYGGYTPGPLYAIGLLAGLLGALSGLLHRKAAPGAQDTPGARGAPDKELAAACLLVTLSAVVLLLSSDAFEFSWRYQLPAVVMLPMAGALGLTAVLTATGGTGRRTRPAPAGSGPQAPAAR